MQHLCSFYREVPLLCWLLQVLSVVAQQLLTIQHALKANLNKFWFEGRPIKLVPTCGVRADEFCVAGCTHVRARKLQQLLLHVH